MKSSPDDDTLLDCARCAAAGTKRDENGERISGEVACWVCGGIGGVSLATARAYAAAGKPDVMPEGWDRR